MRPQLIMFCYGVFIVGTILSLISSGAWFGAQEQSVINTLAGFSVVNVEAMGGWAILKSIGDWFNAIVTAVSWNYPYLNNPCGWVFKAVLLYPVTIGVVVTLVQLATAVVQGIAGTIRSLLPGA